MQYVVHNQNNVENFEQSIQNIEGVRVIQSMGSSMMLVDVSHDAIDALKKLGYSVFPNFTVESA